MRSGLLIAMLVLVGCGSDPSGDTTTDGDVPGDTTSDGDASTDGADVEGIEPCAGDGDCDDGDPCTVDTCDTDGGFCDHEPVDADGDGYAAMEVDGTACSGTDCNDRDDAVHPDADLGCGADDDLDCDGVTDLDEDRDGFTSIECGGEDCDDEDDGVFPGSTDLRCDDDDRDCNGHPDHDNDDDGSDAAECDGSDCDDTDPTVNRSATEIECDGKDTDCDGYMHATEDGDRDGYASETCVADGHEADCDDSDVLIYPGAPELCDEVDQDCDGSWADGGADDDGDTHLDETCGGDDCDDTRSDTYSGADEVCGDGIDQDCDGSADGLTRMLDDVRVTTTSNSSSNPALVWTGSEYAVAWDQYATGRHDIQFVRISGAGTLLGSAQWVTSTSFTSEQPSLVFAGSGYGMAWTDLSFVRSGVFFQRLDTAGTTLGTRVRMSDVTEPASFVSLVWTGSEYAAAWTGDQSGWREVMFGRVDAAGGLLGSQVRVTTDPDLAYGPSLAWSGSGHGVLWQTSFHDITFARLTDTGTKLGSDVTVATGTTYLHEPALAWTGSEYGAAWAAHLGLSGGTYFVRIDASGALVGSPDRISGADASSSDPSIEWTGSEFAIAWSDYRSSSNDVYLVRVSASGTTLGSEVEVSSTSFSCRDPVVAWTGSEYGVIWQDQRHGLPEIYFNRVGFCE
jgi:hypothetical protein